MENLYRCFSTGMTRRKLIPADNNYLSEAQELIDKSPTKDFYESIYLYNKSHFDKFKETGSMAGMKDGVKTDRIVFDFDSKDSVNEAKKDAAVVVGRLQELNVPNNAIRIFYSANKGFHVEVHINKYLNRNEFENIVEYYAGDLKTFDHKIKDEQRLFRFPLTKHNVSGRYKIPLTISQLDTLTMEEIEKLSKSQDHTPFHDVLNSYEVTDLFVEPKSLIKKEKKEDNIVYDPNLIEDRPDLTRKPKHLTPAKYALQEGFFNEGERNEACMILAATYKYLGYSEEHTYNIIKATLRLRARRLGIADYDKKELWETIVKPVFAVTWKGGTFSEEDGLLKRTIERYNLSKIDITDAPIVEMSALASQYLQFAVNIDKNTIKLGIDEIDRKVRITTSMLVAFLAAPGAGKTSISLGILNTLSKTGETAIFFSMDMAMPQVYQRLIQKHTGHTSDQILDNFKNQRKEQIEVYQEALNEEYKNVRFCFKTGLSPEHMKQIAIQEEQKTGKKIKLALIDYLECIDTGVSDPTQSKAVAASALKNIANDLELCVFLLTQPAKISGDPSGELTSYTQIKGSGVVAEASSVVMTLSRPGFDPKNPDDDNYATINVVKNRMGVLSSTDLHWDGLSGNIRTLSGQEENDLKALRSAIAQAKSEQKSVTGSDLY